MAAVSASLVMGGSTATLAQQLDDITGSRVSQNNKSAQVQAQIDQISDQTDSKIAELRRELETIQNLRDYNARLGRLINSQETEKSSLTKQIDDVAKVERGILPLMGRMIDTLDQFVDLDVPFLVSERRDRVEKLKETIERADITVAEKYRSLMEAYQIEAEYGRTIGSYTGTVEIDGNERAVEFLRLGRLTLVYQTQDGEAAGRWDQQARDWVELESGYRDAVQRGIRIARNEAAKDLINLPIPGPEAAK